MEFFLRFQGNPTRIQINDCYYQSFIYKKTHGETKFIDYSERSSNNRILFVTL